MADYNFISLKDREKRKNSFTYENVEPWEKAQQNSQAQEIPVEGSTKKKFTYLIDDEPETDNTPQGIKDIINASQKKLSYNPNIQPDQYNVVPGFMGPDGRTGQQKLVRAPRRRIADPVTREAIKTLLAPARAFTEGIPAGMETLKESGQAIADGDVLGGAVGTAAGLLQTGMSAATPFVPGMAAFAGGTSAASDAIGEDAVNTLMAPVSTLTKPESLFGRGSAAIADALIQAAAGGAINKGISSVRKGIQGKNVPEQLTAAESLIKPEVQEPVINPAEQEFRQPEISPVQETKVIANPQDRFTINKLTREFDTAIKENRPVDEKPIISQIENITDPAEKMRLESLYNQSIEHNKQFANRESVESIQMPKAPEPEILQEAKAENTIQPLQKESAAQAEATVKGETLDPEIMKHLPTVTAYYIEDAISNGIKPSEIFSEYSKKMLDDFGEEITPYLKKVYNKTLYENKALKKMMSQEVKAVLPGQAIPKVQGKGETKVRGLSKNTEARAIVAGITKGLEDLPEYNVLKNQPQIEQAADLIANDFNRARRIALGEEKSPDSILPGFIYRGLEEYAKKNNDVQVIKDLGTSKYLAEEGTAAGQFIQSLKGQDPLSPVKAIKEVVAGREASRMGQHAKKLETKITELENQIKLKDDKIRQIEAEKVLKQMHREEKVRLRQEKRTITKEVLDQEFDDIIKEFAKSSGKLTAGIDPQQAILFGKLARNRVQRGIVSVEEVVDHIYQKIKDIDPKITPRDIRDAISGYGREPQQNRSEAVKKYNDLKRQAAIISKIEDIEAGKTPARKTGTKAEPSEELSQLKAQLVDKLKESGIADQETLTRSKARIQNEMQKIQDKINRGEFDVEEREPTPTDLEKESLQSKLDGLRSRYNEVKNRIGEKITDEEAQKIVELSNRTTEAKAKMDGSRRRNTGEEATAEELEYGRSRVEFSRYIDELKNSNSKLADDLKYKPAAAIWGGIKRIPGVSKSAKATLDNSGLFNQHIKTLWTHPAVWARNARKSFIDIARTFGGKNVLEEISADILSRPNYENYIKDKVAIGTIEEAFPDSKLLEKVPVLGRVHKAADAAFTGLAFRNRADLYDLYTDIAKKAGIEKTTGLGLGKLVNSLTGRGDLGSLEKSANTINNILFSPRFVKSHLDVLTAHAFDKNVSPFVKKQAGINLMKIVGGTAAIMVTAKAMAPESVELDPRSSDFGKIKIGNTRFNITGGMGSITTLAARLATLISNGVGVTDIPNYKSTSTGELKQLNTGRYGELNGWDILHNFVDGKLSPIAGVARDLLEGQTYNGKRVTFGGELSNLAMPLPITNLAELSKDPNSAPMLAAVLADALGIFTSTYSNDPDLRKTENMLLRADKEKLNSRSFRTAVIKALRNKAITKDQAAKYIEEFSALQKKATRKRVFKRRD